MKSQAEGWFIILDPAAPVSKSQKYYINLTSSNYLIISTERGGKELRNVDVSKYDSLAKEQVGNEMHIKLSKHFNENIPNIQISNFQLSTSQHSNLEVRLISWLPRACGVWNVEYSMVFM